MMSHWYEKLTFGLAMLCLILATVLTSWILVIFEVMFFILWILADYIPISDVEGRA